MLRLLRSLLPSLRSALRTRTDREIGAGRPSQGVGGPSGRWRLSQPGSPEHARGRGEAPEVIEFVHVEETIPEPTTAGFFPTRGRLHAEVTTEGSGFGEPASRNLVYFGSEIGGPAEIISGNSTTLKVKSYSSVGSSNHIIVRTPGGKRAVSANEFVVLGPPAKVIMVAGTGQSGQVGTSLAPMSVKVLDGEQNGLSGEAVSFRMASGTGSLSVTEVTTDDDGLASTVLTLSTEPGVVKVEAKVYGFDPLVFTATATP